MGAFSYRRTRNIAPDFQLGRYCSVATGVSLSEQEHPLDHISTHPFTTRRHMVDLATTEFDSEVTILPHRFTLPAPSIGHDVWIGEGAVIKRGISIGAGAVVAARAYVAKDVPPYAIVGGLPARMIRYRFDERTREALLASEWWLYRYTDLPRVDPRNVLRFAEALSEVRASGDISEYRPPSIEVADELLAFVQVRRPN
jgi:virginiamycin A acetyltransferase